MDRGAAVALTIVVGGALASQAPINARLGGSVGSVQAAAISFGVGTVLLVTIATLSADGWSRLGEVRGLSPVYLVGGLLGAAYITTALTTVRTLGPSGLTAATIGGQLSAALLIDQLGLFGVEQKSVTVTKLAGVALLAAGAYLVLRE